MAPAVLIVDDDAAIRMILSAALEALGFETYECSDGDEAVACVDEVEPVLILIDWCMPRMGGEEAVPLLKQRCDAPVVVVSANVAPQYRYRILGSGCDGFVGKPIDFTVFEQVVARLVPHELAGLEREKTPLRDRAPGTAFRPPDVLGPEHDAAQGTVPPSEGPRPLD